VALSCESLPPRIGRLVLRFGIITPPVPGHIHPFGALGRELIERGHSVTVVHMADLENRTRAEGLGFVPIGQTAHPAGSLPQSLAALGRLKGMAALGFTIRAVAKTTEMMLRDGPAAIRNAGVEMLLVDQTEPAGGTIAEHLGLPFVTICNALMLNREADIPPPFTPWKYQPDPLGRLRNRIGYAISDRMLRPVGKVVAAYRRKWALPAHKTSDESFSNLAQIAQQPPIFDFPRHRLPACFHYAGPLRKPALKPLDFPWEALNGRPLIYASLGTLQNNRADVFRTFAEAAAGLDAQLVITHGGALDGRELEALPGNPVVVSYAPQIEVLRRARLTLTHAGLNTVLDSLSQGVPAIAIPITYEQPAIAERLRRTGAGEVLPFSALRVDRLRALMERLLHDDEYLTTAKKAAASIQTSGGVTRAADIILATASR
jgi:zeaxanthin glucosyltransferase